MTGDVGEYSAEWRILECLCLGIKDESRRTEVRELVGDRTNWGELLDLALRHKMLTLVAHDLLDLGLAAAIPYRIADHLRGVLAGNRYRRTVWYRELFRVLAALDAAGITVAARKGAAYESSLYSGDGSRWLGDLDLLIAPSDMAAVAELMPSLGYQVGLYDFDSDAVIPFDRKELVKYRLNPDHLPTQSLVTGDLLVPVIEVDFASSLTWARSEYQVPTADALLSLHRQSVPGLDGQTVPCPDPAYQFLDTVLHLFREAWIEWWLAMEQDVDLMKFGDVLRLYAAHRDYLLDGGRLRSMLDRYGVTEPVCWVLEHLDRTFGTSTVASFGLAGVASEEFLFSAGGAGLSTRRWSGSMRDRLATRARSELFEDAR